MNATTVVAIIAIVALIAIVVIVMYRSTRGSKSMDLETKFGKLKAEAKEEKLRSLTVAGAEAGGKLDAKNTEPGGTLVTHVKSQGDMTIINEPPADRKKS